MNAALPLLVERALLGLVILGAALWMGGFVAIMVVSATSKKSLEPKHRIALFRGLGRNYLKIAAVAFALVVIPGGVLLALRARDGFTLAILLVSLALVVVTACAVRQARRLTRMRRAAAADPGDSELLGSIVRTAGAARVLRTGIGLLSLALFVLALAIP